MGSRIGILGGTFDPVHIGHIILAQDAMERFRLDRVLFIPSFRPPHKLSRRLTAAAHRLAMLKAALEPYDLFALSTMEIDRGGISFTIDTVRELRRRFPKDRFFFIIGADTLWELHSWKDIDDLMGLCRFVSAARPGFELSGLTSVGLGLANPWPARLKASIFTGHLVEISSSEIRRRVARGLSIRYLVPQPVERYIFKESLYKTQKRSS